MTDRVLLLALLVAALLLTPLMVWAQEVVLFELDPRDLGKERATRVFLAGEFNDWDPEAWPLTRNARGVFQRRVELKRGVYRYKFVVDGEWHADPRNPHREPSGHRNSLRSVGGAPLDPGAAQGPAPRPQEARPGAFHTVPAGELKAPPGGLAPRPLYVYLPPSYEAEPQRRFPVLYLHDGQNVWSDPTGCFGHGGWYVDATCERLWKARELKEFILVGVPNSPERMREYGPRDLLARSGGVYLRYLAEVVKPAVDTRYRTKPGAEHTALMGSSLGGLISFVGGLSRPELFGQVACLSSSFWFEDAAGRTPFDLLRARGRQPVRIYLDSGTGGRAQDGAPNTRKMAKLLRETGWKRHQLTHHEEPGAEHNERAWRARAERPLRFLFGR